jgi:hypothetical protein
MLLTRGGVTVVVVVVVVVLVVIALVAECTWVVQIKTELFK